MYYFERTLTFVIHLLVLAAVSIPTEAPWRRKPGAPWRSTISELEFVDAVPSVPSSVPKSAPHLTFALMRSIKSPKSVTSSVTLLSLRHMVLWKVGGNMTSWFSSISFRKALTEASASSLPSSTVLWAARDNTPYSPRKGITRL